MDAFYGGLAAGFGLLLFSAEARKKAAKLGNDLTSLGNGAEAFGGAGLRGEARPVGGAGTTGGSGSGCCCGGSGKSGGATVYRPISITGRLSGPSSPAPIFSAGPSYMLVLGPGGVPAKVENNVENRALYKYSNLGIAL